MNRFEQMRYERGLTLGDVAEGTGLTRQTVRAVEHLTGDDRPTAPTTKALADFYGTSVAELLGLETQDAA